MKNQKKDKRRQSIFFKKRSYFIGNLDKGTRKCAV